MTNIDHLYLKSDQYKFICCTIPKCASTSLRKWFLFIHNLGDKHPHGNEISQFFTKSTPYFSFVYIRNPYARIVSAYIDKIMNCWQKNARAGRKEVANIQKLNGRPLDFVKGISFKEFAIFVSKQYICDLDLHWTPYYRILGNRHFDFVGHLEQFSEHWLIIKEKIGLSQKPTIENTTKYINIHWECLADKCCDEVRKNYMRTSYIPHYSYFYDEETLNTISNVYIEDIQKYKYQFEDRKLRPKGT